MSRKDDEMRRTQKRMQRDWACAPMVRWSGGEAGRRRGRVARTIGCDARDEMWPAQRRCVRIKQVDAWSALICRVAASPRFLGVVFAAFWAAFGLVCALLPVSAGLFRFSPTVFLF